MGVPTVLQTFGPHPLPHGIPEDPHFFEHGRMASSFLDQIVDDGPPKCCTPIQFAGKEVVLDPGRAQNTAIGCKDHLLEAEVLVHLGNRLACCQCRLMRSKSRFLASDLAWPGSGPAPTSTCIVRWPTTSLALVSEELFCTKCGIPSSVAARINRWMAWHSLEAQASRAYQ